MTLTKIQPIYWSVILLYSLSLSPISPFESFHIVYLIYFNLIDKHTYNDFDNSKSILFFSLKGKLQKHQAFEAEVIANKERIFSIIDMGQG